MKKMTTFVCVAAITASLLAGCGSKTAETTAAATEAAAATESASTEAAVEGTDADKEAAKKVADLIDAIYVQERNDNTDEQCKEAKGSMRPKMSALSAMRDADCRGVSRPSRIFEKQWTVSPVPVHFP